MVAPIYGNPFASVPDVSPPQRQWNTWDKGEPPQAGEICYAIALWKAHKKTTWRPTRPTDVPPMLAGEYKIILWQSRELAAVLADCIDSNARQLAWVAKRKGRRVKSWAVPVVLVAGHEETARPVDPVAIGGVA